MANSGYPRLCCGAFFSLLLQAKKQRQKVRNRDNGGSDGLKDADVLIELIRVAQPHYHDPSPSTFKQNTSEYGACITSSGMYLPFEDKEFESDIL